ncbi:MAG: hypothetical protein K2M20_13435 [Lachnospiraceae bacterium]|nr:hypothetical protein [Lachnospiraceae bacterium]
MSDKKTVKKKKKTNPNLRLIKNGDVEEPKKKKRRGRKREERPEKLRFGRTRRVGIMLAVLFSLFFLLTGGFLYIINNYKVTTVHVDGSIHYTNEEIMEMVMGGRFGDNSLLLSLKYRDKGIEGVPLLRRWMWTLRRKTPFVLRCMRRHWRAMSDIWDVMSILTRTALWWRLPWRRLPGFRR